MNPNSLPPESMLPPTLLCGECLKQALLSFAEPHKSLACTGITSHCRCAGRSSVTCEFPLLCQEYLMLMNHEHQERVLVCPTPCSPPCLCPIRPSAPWGQARSLTSLHPQYLAQAPAHSRCSASIVCLEMIKASLLILQVRTNHTG